MKDKMDRYISEKYGSSLSMSQRMPISNRVTGEVLFEITAYVVIDHISGSKQRLVYIPKCNEYKLLHSIAVSINQIFNVFDGVGVIIGDEKSSGTIESTMDMPFSPKIILLLDEVDIPSNEMVNIFLSVDVRVQIVDLSKLYQYKSVFISYGGKDEDIVKNLNFTLIEKGIKTWFFPNDAKPGQKLHRMMSEGVMHHDKVLLVCSKTSLSRNGVLNEIERVLEREAEEGGSDILIPVTLDDFVYQEWSPERDDIARHIKARVIINVNPDSPS